MGGIGQEVQVFVSEAPEESFSEDVKEHRVYELVERFPECVE
jgi:hypothetical protein